MKSKIQKYTRKNNSTRKNKSLRKNNRHSKVNKMRGGSVSEDIERLKRNDSTLTMLDLSKEGIDDDELEVLADALKMNSNLTTLNISNNFFYKDGVNALAEALKNNKTLTTLIMRDNNINVVAVANLADALKNNTSLTELDIARCNINDVGIRALSIALIENQTLTNLYIEGNNFLEALKDLKSALEKNYSIIDLRFYSRNLREKVASSNSKEMYNEILYYRINKIINRNKLVKNPHRNNEGDQFFNSELTPNSLPLSRREIEARQLQEEEDERRQKEEDEILKLQEKQNRYRESQRFRTRNQNVLKREINQEKERNEAHKAQLKYSQRFRKHNTKE